MDVSTMRGNRSDQQEVRQGCVLSSLSFNVYSEFIFGEILVGVSMPHVKGNMVISVAKSKVLTIAKEPKRCKLAIYNEPVEQVMSFKYLGVDITSCRNLQEEVKAQTTKATLISGYLRDVVWPNKHITIQSKIRIYKTCIRPIMTYAMETRAENSTTKRISRTAEMRVLRSIAGLSLRYHIRNEDIGNICDSKMGRKQTSPMERSCGADGGYKTTQDSKERSTKI